MSTGIVRRIDELGRIVIPKEIRKNLRIKNGDCLEITMDGETICLKKFSQVENVTEMAQIYTDSFYQVLKYNIIVTDTDKVVAASGNLKNKYLNQGISDKITTMIERRDALIERKKSELEIIPGIIEYGYYAVSTINNNGDSIGSVIILSLNKPMLEQEEKLAMILANILGNYFG